MDARTAVPPHTCSATGAESEISATEATAAGVTSPADARADHKRVLCDTDALAEEVLLVYEQLSLVFDVTARLAGLTDANEVERLLCNRLRTILNTPHVWCVDSSPAARGAEGCASVGDEGCCLPPETASELTEFIARVRREHRVLVHTFSSRYPGDDAGYTHAMAGLLMEWEGTSPHVLCVIRREKEFLAGEMLLLESILAFGAHFLRNLHLVEQIQRTSFEAVRALVNAVEKKDAYTSGHSERVGLLARLIGREMELPASQLQQLEWAGLLHDIGKIGIPETVLNKRGPLTDGERAVIRRHPQMSSDVLKPVSSLEPVRRVVLEHHENLDGSGYPMGLRGERISLLGRILHVADVFDALTSDRPYRPAHGVQGALEIMRQEVGTKLDPAAVQKLEQSLDRIRQVPTPALEHLFARSRHEPE